VSGNLSLFFYGSWILGGVIVASFIAWSQLRDRPAWDGALFGAASLAMAIFIGVFLYLDSFERGVLTFSLIPSLFIYFWFTGLWTVRRERAAVYRWGVRHGYRITSLDRTYSLGQRFRMHDGYRIVARRLSDGQLRVGRVLLGDRRISGGEFNVLWEGEISPHHLHAPPPHPEPPPPPLPPDPKS
jgi:hypothetical protein